MPKIDQSMNPTTQLRNHSPFSLSIDINEHRSDYWVLFICRAINGAGAIGAISSAFVLTGEIFEPDSRVMALQVAQGKRKKITLSQTPS